MGDSIGVFTAVVWAYLIISIVLLACAVLMSVAETRRAHYSRPTLRMPAFVTPPTRAEQETAYRQGAAVLAWAAGENRTVFLDAESRDASFERGELYEWQSELQLACSGAPPRRLPFAHDRVDIRFGARASSRLEQCAFGILRHVWRESQVRPLKRKWVDGSTRRRDWLDVCLSPRFRRRMEFDTFVWSDRYDDNDNDKDSE